jgi:hypothetical protein
VPQMSNPGFGVLRKPDGTVITKTALLATLGAAAVDDPTYQMPEVGDGGYRVLEDIPDPGGPGYTPRLVLAEGTQIRASEVDTMFPAATFTSIAPATAEGAGVAVTIKGTNFGRSGTTVAIGGVAATSVVVVDEETITAVTGAHAAGVVNVVVTTTSGAVTGTNAFTYTGDPTITLVAPATGLAAGGTAVTLTGANYVAGATVTFGAVAATSIVVVSGTSITCATPAHAAGAVNVVVTTAYGAATSVGGFTYT